MSATRILHTMLRVTDMKRSIDFYTKVMGMKHLRTVDVPQEEYTLAFLGYCSEAEGAVIELTYNYGQNKPYDHGSAYGHIAFGVMDVKAFVANCKELKVPVDYDSGDGFMAFIQDPDGYSIELLDDARMMKMATGKEEQKTS